MYVETNLDMDAITNVFDTTLSGTIRIGGKLYNSTTGEIFTDDVEIIINSDYEIVDVLVAGQSVSGVYPAKAVNGVFIGESTEVGKTFTNTTTVLPLSGVVTSGGGKMMMPAKVRLSEDTNIQSNTTIGVSNAPKSGTIISGEGTEPVVQTSVSNGSEVSGKVIVSAATIKRCGTKACGK